MRKYQIGDKVKVVRYNNDFPSSLVPHFPIGSIHTITNLNNSSYVRIKVLIDNVKREYSIHRTEIQWVVPNVKVGGKIL